MVKTKILAAMTALALFGVPAVDRARGQDVPAATVPVSEQFTMQSKTGAVFLIQVAKPFEVAPRPPAGQKTPVIYLLDGSYLTGMMAVSARFLPLENSARSAYVVGIGFPEESFAAYGARRNRDLVHVTAGPQGPGGGAELERFLREELRPAIESRYPVDPAQSILAGHSLGGLFTATVLANDPTAFSGYLIGSPSLQFDPALVGRLQAASSRGAGRRVYIGVGEAEGALVGQVDGLEKALRMPGSGFIVTRKTFAGETHVSVQGAWMANGLKNLLPPAPR